MSEGEKLVKEFDDCLRAAALKLDGNSALDASKVVRNFFDEQQLRLKDFFDAMSLDEIQKLMAQKGGLAQELTKPALAKGGSSAADVASFLGSLKEIFEEEFSKRVAKLAAEGTTSV
eukprot:Trichotokara_eunicae@DN2393_c0_g1_i2.p1